MSYRVRLTHRARIQLFNIASWWASHRSLEEAARWLQGFDDLIDQLGTDPDRHPLASESHRFGVELRQINYGLKRKKTHRAVFEVRDDEVVVHAIRHLSQEEVGLSDLN